MNFFRRIVAPSGVGAIAVVLYAIMNSNGWNDGLVELNEFYGEQFFAVIATLYAIITALILVKGIESFDALSSAINREAMQLRSINAYLQYFELEDQDDSGASVKNLRANLMTYATNVLEQNTADRSTKNDAVIDECVGWCGKISVADENDRMALQEIMRGLDGLRRLRADRISLAQEKIPEYLIIMLAAMTVAILAPFYLHHVTGASFNYYIIFILAVFGSFIFFLLNDINRPYTGAWKVSLEPFKEAHTEITAKAG